MSLVSFWLVSLLTLGSGAPVPPLQNSTEQLTSETELPVPTVAADASSTGEKGSLENLSALHDSRQSKLLEIETLRASFDVDGNSTRRLEQLAELGELQKELAAIQFSFETVATGIDVRSFDLGVDQDFDLVSEVKGLLKPIVAELREATAAPREMDRLRGSMAFAEEHQVLARRAIANLDELVKSAEASQVSPERREELVTALRQSQEAWRNRLQDQINAHNFAKFQIDQRESNQRPLLESAKTALGDFGQNRGLNLLYALGAFLGILFGLQLVHRAGSRVLGKRGKGERKFYARLIDVLYFAFSGLAALGGALLVLFSANDYAVIGLVLLLLAGLAWAGKAAVPLFLEQIRLLLNLGTVREGERIIYQGLPWRVARLSLHARLQNPELTGGRIRVPLRDMTELRSRRTNAEERWFPTSPEDWILLDGERLACVMFQSTEVVRVRLQGGSEMTYPTSDFQGLCVENLSSGFRVSIRFGIDYEFQSVCTSDVPQLMQDFLTEKLTTQFGAANTNKVNVEFLEAAASSLDYAVLVDFKAEAAPAYNELRRAIGAFLVDACNKYGWGIPFTQVTIHQS